MDTFLPIVRPVEQADIAQILEINNANTPAVSKLSMAELELDLTQCLHAYVINDEDYNVCGFCITFDENALHAGVNHKWFAERHENFVYLDRIAFALKHQRRGFGALLYAEVERQMTIARTHSLLCCEVNVEPPNPGSLRFHKRLGFVQVGEQRTSAQCVVTYLTKFVTS